jgi:phosphoribosyl 1,2-cyclic phosphodiesterase
VLRYASLGSGSKGNATLVEADGTRVLVDCGFSLSETERRLQRRGLQGDDLHALLVTHEHADHVGGIERLARRYGLPVWLTAGTLSAARLDRGLDLRVFHAHEPFAIDALRVEPFPVPHDAREPSQFVFGDGAHRLGLLTDIGSVTPHVRRSLDGCDALLLECNYEPELLARGPYPAALKARVGGRLGHLSNQQAAALLADLECADLQGVIAMHISEQNNTPTHARTALAGALGCAPDWIEVACQEGGFDWHRLG